MAVVEILGVETSPLDTASLYGAVLVCPTAGLKSDASRLEISGWALGRTCRVEWVEAVSGPEVLGRIAVDQPRPGIGKAFPDAPHAARSGFQMTVDGTRLSADFRFEVNLVMADGTRLPLAAVRGNRDDSASAPAPQAQGNPLQRFEALLAYANPYMKSPVEPPVGVPMDFISETNLRSHIAEIQQFGKIDVGAELLEYASRDTSPIPAPCNRAMYFKGYDDRYWLSGLADYLKTVEVARRHGVTGGRMLEFGGSTGRVFRHFIHQTDNWDVWACDLNITSVDWLLNHMSPKGKFFLNSYYPTLPLEDNSFDLITAYSVFTHLDETELGWLLELRRILKPGGCAYLTIHDEHTWREKAPALFNKVAENRPDLVDMVEMPQGKTVVNWCNDSPSRCNVFHSSDYIDRVWGRFFHIAERIPLGHNIQSVCVVRK